MISSRKVSEEFILSGARYIRVSTIDFSKQTQKVKWYVYKHAKNAITNRQEQHNLEQFYQQYIRPDVRRWLQQTGQI